MQRVITGAMGGGGGGSEFVTKPDTLRSNDSFEILFGLGSGRWKGLVNGLKSLKINDVPMENADGSSNFDDVAAIFADGNPLETQLVNFKLGGGGDVQSIGVALSNPNTSGPGPWVVGATSTPNAEYIDMRFVVQQLFKQDEKSIRENTATIEVEMRPSNSATWTNPFIGTQSNNLTYNQDGYSAGEGIAIYLARKIFNISGTGFTASNNPNLVIKGKTTSAYVKELRIAVPNTGNYANVTWEVRARLIEKDTVDQDENQERRTIAFESIASITTDTLGDHEDWRGQVWLQVIGKASDQFNGFPEITGVYDTKICATPPTSVWNPETRVYTGTTWAGDYEEHFTTDPAWQMKEFIEDPIHGVAGLQPGSTLDKWDCLAASQYFSELVPDGRGGTHPRFNMNLTINEARDVTEMLQYLAGSVNSYIEDVGDGKWRLVVDKPEVPKVLFTEANVFGGFSYSHTDVDSRFNDWRGTFLNEDLDYEQDTVRVFDQTDIDENGTRFTEIALVGCTNRQEALRRLMFRLRVSLNEYKIVSFTTNRIGRYLSPLDTILVADAGLNADHLVKSDSRIASHSGTTVTLMRPVRLEVGVNYTMVFTTPAGVTNRTVMNSAGNRGDVTQIEIDSPLPVDVLAESAVSLEAVGLAANPVSYRVLSVEKSENDEDEYIISASIIDSGKWNAMDNVSETEILAQESAIEIDSPAVPAGGMFDLITYTTDYEIRRTLQVNWDRPGGSFLEGFKIEYRYNDGPWRLLHSNLSDSFIHLEDPQDGFYDFKVTSLDRRGVVSNPLLGSYEVTGSQDIHAPTHVRGTLIDRPMDAPYVGYRYTVTDGTFPVTYVWDGTNWVPEGNLVTEGSHIGVENGATVGMTDDEALTVADIQQDITDLFTVYGDTASAAASASAAETAAQNAQTAETNAETAFTNASAALTAAEAARDAAAISATNADSSATASAGSASAAQTSATDAGNSASAAESSRLAAETAETNAGNSASAAALSESAAAASETAAGQSASAANQSKLDAQTAAGNASTSASNAATSESNAAGSANTASTQATNAANSANAAGNSATAAAGSASTASTKANEASASASAALSSQTAAAGSASNAATSANTATTQASNASASASLASSQASLAASYANTAVQPATLSASFFTGQNAGSPTAVPNAQATTTGAGGATIFRFTAQYQGVGTKNLIPAVGGEKVRITAKLTHDQSGAAPQALLVWRWLDKDFNVVSSTTNAVFPVTNSQVDYTSETTAQLGVGIAWCRPQVRKESSGGAALDLYQFRAFNSTTLAATESSASAASSSAAAASASAASASTSESLSAGFATTAKQQVWLTMPSDFSSGSKDHLTNSITAVDPNTAPTVSGAVVDAGADGKVYETGVAAYAQFLQKAAILPPKNQRRYRLEARVRRIAGSPTLQVIPRTYGVSATGSIIYETPGPVWDNSGAVMLSDTSWHDIYYEWTSDHTNPAAVWTRPTFYTFDASGVYTGTIIQVQHYRILDVTESTVAAAQAVIATDQAVIATSQAAAAQSSAVLAASLSSNSLNNNARFADFPTTGGTTGFAPPGWVNWASSPSNRTRYSVPDRSGEGSPYAIVMDCASGGNAGLSQVLYKKYPGWYVIEATVELLSGTFVGSGCYLNLRTEDGATNVGGLTLRFDTDPDIAGTVVGNGTVNRIYRFAKLVQATPANMGLMTLFAMSGWTGFVATPAAKNLRWYKCAVRPASDAEIEAGTAIPALEASVSVNQGAIATLQSQAAFYEIEVAAGGGQNAVARLIAGQGGSSIDLAADRISLWNDSNNSVVPALTLSNGNALFSGELNVGAASGARVNITQNLIRVYDSNGTLRVRMGVW